MRGSFHRDNLEREPWFRRASGGRPAPRYRLPSGERGTGDERGVRVMAERDLYGRLALTNANGPQTEVRFQIICGDPS